MKTGGDPQLFKQAPNYGSAGQQVTTKRSNQISPLNPCCRKASNKTNATQFDKFSERDFELNIGIRSQRSRFCSSNGSGNPALITD
jgi:hypothetical protein